MFYFRLIQTNKILIYWFFFQFSSSSTGNEYPLSENLHQRLDCLLIHYVWLLYITKSVWEFTSIITYVVGE